MPLMDHLRELRNRLVKSILVIILGMIVALVFSNQTLNIVARPFCSAVINGHTGCHVVGDQLVINGVFDGVLPAHQDRLLLRPDRHLPGLAVPALGVHRARAIRAREEVGLPVHGHGRAVVRQRRGARVRGDGPRPALPAQPGAAELAGPAQLGHLSQLLHRDAGRVRDRLRAAARDRHAEHGRHPHPRAVPQVAAGADLRHLPDRGHRQPEPGPVDDAHPRRARGRAGRGRRDLRLLQRQAPGAAAPGSRTTGLPTTSCPRCSSTAKERTERCSTCLSPSCWFSR